MVQNEKKPGRETLFEALALYVEDHRKEAKWRTRRWAFVVVSMLAYMSFNVWLAVHNGDIVPVAMNYATAVRIDGPIMPGKAASTKVLFPTLEKAFSDDKAKCVALIINSPGGAVGQSEMLHDQILKLAAKHNKKVIAVGEDLMASGGYMVATSASKIYAPRMAAVGSIGVRQDGYDLTGIADKLGIKDRTLTAGKMKDANNPLKPLSAEAEAKARHDLELIHTEFKRVVREARGDRLKAADDDVFTGEVFTGFDGYKLGLLDGYLDIDAAVKADCGADAVHVIEPSLGLSDLLGFVSGF